MRLVTLRASTSRVISSALPALSVPSQRWRPSKKLLSSFQAQVARPSRSPVRETSSVRMSMAVTWGELLLKTRISPASPTGASATSPAVPPGALSGPPSPHAAASTATPRPPRAASSRRRGKLEGVHRPRSFQQPGNPANLLTTQPGYFGSSAWYPGSAWRNTPTYACRLQVVPGRHAGGRRRRSCAGTCPPAGSPARSCSPWSR